MKLLLSLGVATIVVVGGLMYFPSKVEVITQEPQVVEKEVEVDALEQSIKSAQDAKKAEIEATANKAWQDAYNLEMKKIEAEVLRAFNKKLDARQIELEKETKEYWRDRGNVVQLIRDTFPEDAERMIAIAQCESGLNPEAKGPTQDGGIFQIHMPSHGERMKALGLDIWNPEDNVKFARMLYDESGITPWVCAGPKFLAFKR